MKGSIFVVALLAASLTSASAFAHGHSHGSSGPSSSNVSIVSQWGGSHNTATVVQAQSITVVIGGFGY
jgi:hypothetical protein